MTAEDRDRLAFGNVDRRRKEGRSKADGYWEDLPGVEILTRKASTPAALRSRPGPGRDLEAVERVADLLTGEGLG